MRTIKFRGKTTKGAWLYGDLEHRVDDGTKMTYIFDDVLSQGGAVLPETVGQFVGLHDDNDREIYEGDIIHIKRGSVDKDFGIVKWNTNGYFFIDDTFSNKEKDANPIGNFFESIRIRRDDIEITVNGNIHDNPESIKDGKVMRIKDVESICLALGWNYNEQTKKYTKKLPDGFCAILQRVSDTRFYLGVLTRQHIPAVEETVRTYKEVEQILEDFE